MKTLSALLLSIFIFAGLFSAKPAFANSPDPHQQAMEIHNQHHSQAHQQVMEANRLAGEALRRQNEEAHLEQLKNHQEFNERQLRRLNRSKRDKAVDSSGESSFTEKRRAKREARREARREAWQSE